MPFDAFILRLLAFLSLVHVYSSLPTSPYFHPWHDGSPHGIGPASPGPGPRGRSRARIEVRVLPVFAQSDATRGGDGPNYGPAPQENRYRKEQGDGTALEFPDPFFQRRSSASVDGYFGSESYANENYPVQKFGNTYSSHVNCQPPNQNKEGRGSESKITRQDAEPRAYESEVPGPVSDGTNTYGGSRRVRTGTSREGEPPHPRIITPKGSPRRPNPGNAGINQSNPLNQGVTNAIPTTEKTFGNETHKGMKTTRPNARRPQGSDIVFPDGYRRQKFTPRGSKCGKRATFCEYLGDEYPSDYIAQVLRKEGAIFKEFFAQDVISDFNITQRINVAEENSLCPYRQEMILPKAAQNKEDKWLFIVNQDQYVQTVIVEVCLFPDSQCTMTEGFPLGYTTYCKQKYIERRLVALGEDGKPHLDSFRFPSCCSCLFKYESPARGPLVRSGGVSQPPRS